MLLFAIIVLFWKMQIVSKISMTTLDYKNPQIVVFKAYVLKTKLAKKIWGERTGL